MNININVSLDKSVDSFGQFFCKLSNMSKQKEENAVRILNRILFSFAIFFIVVFWAFGYFILGHTFSIP